MKKDIYEKVESKIEELDLSFYFQILLTSMVYCKVQNPSKRTDEVCLDAIMNVVPEQFNKTNRRKFLAISPRKELEKLEEELEECKNLPTEIRNKVGGYIVSKTVKYYTKIVLDSIIDSSDDEEESEIDE